MSRFKFSDIEITSLRVDENLKDGQWEYDKTKKELSCRPEDFNFCKEWLKDKKLIETTKRMQTLLE